MNDGYVRAGACVPAMEVANVEKNTAHIMRSMDACEQDGIRICVYPELCITGYTCGDLFGQDVLLRQAEKALLELAAYTEGKACISIVGLPLAIGNGLYNCAAVLADGKIAGLVPKTNLPNYQEFYEKRRFCTSRDLKNAFVTIGGSNIRVGCDLLFQDEYMPNLIFGIEICEDLWSPIPPSTHYVKNGATVVFNLSASNELIGKREYRRSLIMNQSAKCICGYVYSSCGAFESTTDMVFGGHALIAEYGVLLAESTRFAQNTQRIVSEIDMNKLMHDRRMNTSFYEGLESDEIRMIHVGNEKPQSFSMTRKYEKTPFVPSDPSVRDARCEEIFQIQTAALAKRLRHIGTPKPVIGISGGLDSTLALLVVVKTMDLLNKDRKDIEAITMPGFGTTERTFENAMKLIRACRANARTISIEKACLQHFKDIGHDPNVHDVTYENVQARERTQILMDVANQVDGLVIGTGDLSETALGFCTYNGDHMSMYSVNISIPKTLVAYLVRWVADGAHEDVKRVLYDILDTPISPELLPNDDLDEHTQKTEEIIGPYVLHDFFLYHFIRNGTSPDRLLRLAAHTFEDTYCKDKIRETLKTFLKRFFSQQFKRSCMPDGPKVGTVSLSPRGDWRMPSDAKVETWLHSLD